MYIENTGSYYDSDGGQHSRRGWFLILVQPEDDYKTSALENTRALLRKVALHQCGQWMMGSARAFGHRIPISGAYGGDGLTRSVPREVWEKAVPVPRSLMNSWNNGGGWNSAGSEADEMRAWALRNRKQLQPKQ